MNAESGNAATWQHLCRELIRDAAPRWIRETPKGEPCSECGKTEDDFKTTEVNDGFGI